MTTFQTYQLYTLNEPNSDIVRYVGMSQNSEKRYKQHLKEKKHNSYKSHWICKLNEQGLQPKLDIIETDLSLNEAFIKEKHYIKFFKCLGARLVNLTIGGEAPMANKKHSTETKVKMSEDRKGEKNAFYGKKHSSETWDKIKQKLNGRASWNKGESWTEEHRKKLSEIRKQKINAGSIKVWNDGISKIDVQKVFDLKRKGLSQKQIGIELNCAQSNISRILNNKYKRKNR